MTWGEPPTEPEHAQPEPAASAPVAAEPTTGIPGTEEQPSALALRDPAHQVSPRAVAYWRVGELIGAVVLLALMGAAYVFIWDDEKPWWATAVLAVTAVICLVRIVLMPPIRFRVHRWEVTPTAVYTRSGWIGREQRIAPLSRVQTVDSTQGALMRAFNLASITVTTASAAGPITIECLDKVTADEVVAELTAITGRTEGDAT